MDLEENGYVQKRIRFFMGLNFITLISLIEVLEFVSIQYE